MTDLLPARLPASPADQPAALPRPRDGAKTWRTDVHLGWRVDHIQPTPGSVHVRTRPEGVTIVIGDGPDSRPWCTRVQLDADGTASVRTSASPPCVLLTPRDVRVVPDGPENRGRAQLDVGDRLLVMSAEALGALPEALGAMRTAAKPLVDTDAAEDLLKSLLEDLPTGAAVVVVRTSPATSR